MRPRFCALFLLIVAPSAHAIEGRVEKVSGDRAIVIFPEGQAPRAGDILQIGAGGSSSRADFTAPRNHSLSVSASFASTTTTLSVGMIESDSVASVAMAVSSQFGFNLGILELGPSFTFGTTSTGIESTLSLTGGAFVDLNFIRNRPGAAFVPGLTLNAGYAMSKESDSTATAGGLSFGGGLFAKVFVFGPQSLALRFGTGYSMSTLSVSGFSVNIAGISGTAGLQFYF